MAPAWWRARRVRKGLNVKPWVKTSLAPGRRWSPTIWSSRPAGRPRRTRLQLVGYGCTTCIGNSGPLPPISTRSTQAIWSSARSCRATATSRAASARSAGELSGLAAAGGGLRAGRLDDRSTSPRIAGQGSGRQRRLPEGHLAQQAECRRRLTDHLTREMFEAAMPTSSTGTKSGRRSVYGWRDLRTGTRLDLRAEPALFRGHDGRARCIADIVARGRWPFWATRSPPTTSPRPARSRDGPAGAYLTEHQVRPMDFNSYGARRGNHQIMMRGTFANIRIRTRLARGTKAATPSTCRPAK